VAGCCGPMLMSIGSLSSSGSSAGGGWTATVFPDSSTIRGTRMGRPPASRPVVLSPTSSVRLRVTMGLSALLRHSQEPPAHVRRKVPEHLFGGEFSLVVARGRVGGEGLTKLLGAAEPPAQGEVLAERKPLV